MQSNYNNSNCKQINKDKQYKHKRNAGNAVEIGLTTTTYAQNRIIDAKSATALVMMKHCATTANQIVKENQTDPDLVAEVHPDVDAQEAIQGDAITAPDTKEDQHVTIRDSATNQSMVGATTTNQREAQESRDETTANTMKSSMPSFEKKIPNQVTVTTTQRASKGSSED